MNNRPDEIFFTAEDGTEVVFRVIEQTRLANVDYLLVSTITVDEDE